MQNSTGQCQFFFWGKHPKSCSGNVRNQNRGKPWRRLTVDRRALAQPGEVLVACGNILVLMIIRGIGCDRALIAPTMILDVAIRERGYATAIMRAIGKVEEGFLVHIHAKIGPADAVRIDVNEGQQTGGHALWKLAMLHKNSVIQGESAVPDASPSKIRVERIAANLWILDTADFHSRSIGRADINLCGAEISAEQSIARIEH